jgi:hypothetical protein
VSTTKNTPTAWSIPLVPLLATALFSACSGTPSGSADADGDPGDDGSVMDIPAPEPPNIPWLDAGQPPIEAPRMTPCPEGWREVTDPERGTVTCDPWPETGYLECTAIDEAHFPGEPGCTRIGTACSPDDDWATDLPTDRPILYVLAGAPAGGDGTRSSPFGTIADAMGAATGGTIVALSKGSFDEVVAVRSGVTVWGACVAETVVAPSLPSALAAAISGGRASVARNLRVAGERIGISASGASCSLELRDVVVAGVAVAGIRVASDGRLIADNLVVRDTRADPADRTFGRGLEASEGAAVEIHRALLLQNREVAIAAFDPGTSVTLVDVAVRETGWRESDRTKGNGLLALGGATISVQRGAIEYNRDVGVTAMETGTSVVLEEVVVRDTRRRERDRMGGRALEVSGGASAEASRSVFERNREIAVAVFDPGTSVTLTDVVVRDTQSQENDLSLGRGLQVSGGASVDVSRSMFERNRQVAVAVYHVGTSAILADVVVRDTQSRENDETSGMGLQLSDGASAEVIRALFEENRDTALLVALAGTTATLVDILVRDTRSQESTGTSGRGLGVQEGATVEVRHGVFQRNREAAILVSGAGTSVTVEDVVVRDTQGRDCTSEACADRAAGTGVVSLGGAQVGLRRFLLTGSAMCGLQLAHGQDEAGVQFPVGGTMDLHDGRVSLNAVCGANVQTEGFDISRLMDDVLFYDNNGMNLDMDELPVPQATAPLPTE